METLGIKKRGSPTLEEDAEDLRNLRKQFLSQKELYEKKIHLQYRNIKMEEEREASDRVTKKQEEVHREINKIYSQLPSIEYRLLDCKLALKEAEENEKSSLEQFEMSINSIREEIENKKLSIQQTFSSNEKLERDIRILEDKISYLNQIQEGIVFARTELIRKWQQKYFALVKVFGETKSKISIKIKDMANKNMQGNEYQSISQALKGQFQEANIKSPEKMIGEVVPVVQDLERQTEELQKQLSKKDQEIYLTLANLQKIKLNISTLQTKDIPQIDEIIRKKKLEKEKLDNDLVSIQREEMEIVEERELTERCIALKGKEGQVAEECKTVERELKSIEERNSAILEKISKARAEMSLVKGSVNKIQDMELKETENLMIEITLRYNEVLKELEEKKRFVETSQKEKEDIIENKRKIESKLASFQKDIENLTQESTKLKEDIEKEKEEKEVQKKVDEGNDGQIKNLTHSIDSNTQQIRNTQEEINELSNKILKNQQDISLTKDRLNLKETSTKELLLVYREEEMNYQKQIDGLKDEEQKLQKMIQEDNSFSDANERLLKDRRQQIEQLEQKIKNLKEEMEESIRTLEKEKNELRERIKAQILEMQQTIRDLSIQEKRNRELKSQISKLTKQISDLSIAITSQQKYITKHSQTMQEKEASRKKLLEDIEAIVLDYEWISRQIQIAKQRLAYDPSNSINIEIQQLSNILREYKQEVIRLNKLLSVDLSQRIYDLNTELTASQKELNNSVQILGTLKIELETNTKTLEAEKLRLNDTRREFEAKQEEKVVAKKELEGKTVELNNKKLTKETAIMEFQNLTKAKSQLTDKISKDTKQIADHKNRQQLLLRKYTDEVTLLDSQIGQINGRINTLQSTVNQFPPFAPSDMEKVDSEYQNTQTKLQDLEKTYRILQEQWNNLQIQFQDETKQFDQLERKKEMINAHIGELKAVQKQLAKEKEEVKEKIKDLEENIERNTKRIHIISTSLQNGFFDLVNESIVSQKAALESELAALYEEIERDRTKILILKSRHEALVLEIAANANHIVEKNKLRSRYDVKKMRTEVETLKVEITTKNKEFIERIAFIKNNQHVDNEKLAEIKKRCELLATQLKELIDQRNEIFKSIYQFEAESDFMRMSIENMELLSIRLSNQEEITLQQTEEKWEQLNEAYEVSLAEKNSREKDIERLKNDITILKHEKKAAETRRNALMALLGAAKSTTNLFSLRNTINEISKAFVDPELKAEIEKIDKELRECEKQGNVLCEERDKISEELMKYREELKNTKERLASRKRELEEKQKEQPEVAGSSKKKARYLVIQSSPKF
uniref:Uncharacterized protein n=1 Tax=Arcella intermedia TaxID=1963864 RepID=A0A6B2KWG1_9EUKA